MQVLMIGPSPERTKGGMGTVINGILADEKLNEQHKIRFLISHVEGSSFEKLKYFIWSISYILMNSKKIDIAHLHMASGASIYRKGILIFLLHLLKKKIIIHMHGADFDDYYIKSGFLTKKFIKSIFNVSAKTILLSESWRSFVEKNISDKNLVVLNNAVDSEFYSDCISLETNFKTFLFLGRLGQRKGAYDLLAVIDDIVNKEKISDIKFFLAGDGDIEQVKNYVKDHNLNNNVEITGWIDINKKMELLKLANTVLLPSYDEGLPMSLLEGLASGKVLLSTNVGGIPDLIVPEENGFLHTPGDKDDLKRYILKIYNGGEDIKKICENNLLKARTYYDLKKINSILSDIYLKN